MYASALTLLLLWTHTSADSRQGRGLLQHLCCTENVATLYVLYERRYVDVHRTAFNAGWLCTVKTALCLCHCHFECKSLVHFLSACCGTIYGVELWHLNTLYGGALLWLHRGTHFLAPVGVAVGECLYRLFLGCFLWSFGYGVGSCLLHRLFLLSHSTEVVGIVFHFLLLLTLECAHSLEHLIPIHESTVKFRTVDADELRLSANGESASSAHTCSVHHNGVERNISWDIVFLCEQATELHHDRRTYGKHAVDMFLLYEFLYTYGNHTFLAV